jgi:hypothetical protein
LAVSVTRHSSTRKRERDARNVLRWNFPAYRDGAEAKQSCVEYRACGQSEEKSAVARAMRRFAIASFAKVRCKNIRNELSPL